MRVFRQMDYITECDRCRLPFRADKVGVCTSCRRVLCNTHLHGSFFRRLAVDMGFGGAAVCVQCRSGEAVARDREE